MEHGLELIIARLEILEIGVCTLSIILEILEITIFYILDAWKYWKSIFSIFRISWKYWKYDFCWFLGFLQKRRAPTFHAEWSNFHAEISHMRPIQSQKLKLCQTLISKWRRRRRRRRRRRPNNSPIWPEPWTITPRDQISRSGSIPHFDFMQSAKTMYFCLGGEDRPQNIRLWLIHICVYYTYI